MIAETTMQSQARSARLLTSLASLALVMAITTGVFLFRDHLQQLSGYGYLSIFLLTMVGNASVVLPAPAFLTALAGGTVFNPVLVGLVAAAGATIGELTGYMLGMSGRAAVEDNWAYERIHVWMRRYGLVALFALAAIPNPFFDMAGIVAGAMRLPVTHYLLATGAGKLVKFVIIAYLGATFADILNLLP